jgi:NADP-dependent 3-hydroxy acid dehydrogenase YdfG
MQSTLFITGATSGIGEAAARAFAREGARLVLAGRREARLEALAAKLNVPVHTVVLDVRDRAAVFAAVEALPEDFHNVDMLINNAGLALGLTPADQSDLDQWEQMVDTNIKGVLHVTRNVVPGMLARNRGHVIHIGSTAGRTAYPNGVVYCATKFAVRALNEGLKKDLHGTPIRVSSVDPGMVETEFSLVRFDGDAERAETVYENTIPLTAEDVADAVFYCATRPPHVNIAEVLMTSIMQSSATMIHRTA